MNSRTLFIECFDRAIKAALPDAAIRAYLPEPPRGRLVVVGAGKGAAHLARAFEEHYSGKIEGVVVTRYGFGAPCERVKVIEAAHPIPDENSLAASARLMNAVSGLSGDDLVVGLFTGGGSALLASPLPPMTLEDEIAVNKALLASGAPISAMNTLRRHLSAIKGGRLGAACGPARSLCLLVSDVPGDDPAEIASGPMVSGNTTPDDARRVIEDYRLELPKSVHQVLRSPAAHCPKISGETHILASSALSLQAVEDYAKALGIKTINLGDRIEGEAREVAREHAGLVRKKRAEGWRGLIISGGESTVTLKGAGKGGRNTEYLLALAIELDGMEGVFMFAADSDGVDGSEDNAGAFGDGMSAARMRDAGVDPNARLADNDSHSAFAAIGALFTPGPTGTNVNDLRLILLE